MKFQELEIAGAFLIELDRMSDERGHFARTYSVEEFEANGLNPKIVQCNISFNAARGTLRGMHYQVEPHAEAKLIRCTRGRLHDKAIDLRPDSASFRASVSLEMAPDDGHLLYLPEGVAHGFLTLEDATEVSYQMSEGYALESARGVRYDDPYFGLVWPDDVVVISERDATLPDYTP